MARLDDAGTGAGTRGTSCQLVTFVVDDLVFGIDTRTVQEVLAGRTLTPVPLAPPALEGLMNLRGRIVPVLDVRSLLQLAPRRADEASMAIVLRGDQALALAVDRIDDVVPVDDGTREEVPSHVPTNIRAMATGVYQTEHGLLLAIEMREFTNGWWGQPDAASGCRKENGQK